MKKEQATKVRVSKTEKLALNKLRSGMKKLSSKKTKK